MSVSTIRKLAWATGWAFTKRMLTAEAAETETSPHAEVDPFRHGQDLEFFTIHQPMGFFTIKAIRLAGPRPSIFFISLPSGVVGP